MWMLLHRHNDVERSGHPDATPVLFNTTTGCMFMPRMRDAKSDGSFLRTPGDAMRGGLWVRESFLTICHQLEIGMGEDEGKWRT